jgi:hypothetical protein
LEVRGKLFIENHTLNTGKARPEHPVGPFNLISFTAGRDHRHRRANLHRPRPSCDCYHRRRNCGFHHHRPNCGLAPNTSAMEPSKNAKELSRSGTEPGNSGWGRNRCETAVDCKNAADLHYRRWNNSDDCCSSAQTALSPGCSRRSLPMEDDSPELEHFATADLPGDSSFRILLERVHGRWCFLALPKCDRFCPRLVRVDSLSPKEAGSAKARADAASFANCLAHCRSGRSSLGAHLTRPRADLPCHLPARFQTGRMSAGRCWPCEFGCAKRRARVLSARLQRGSGLLQTDGPRVNSHWQIREYCAASV